MKLSNKTIDLSMKLAKLSAKEENGKWIVRGYATVFGNRNVYNFSISKGAYKDVLDASPKMFYNHLTWQNVPLGKWTKLEEDDTGLKVEGELTKGVAMASDVYAALKAGTIDGLSVSVGFNDDDVEEDEDGSFRVLRVSALDEISICAFPADQKARVSETLSADEIDDSIDGAKTVRDIEAVLRDAGRFSKRQAQSLISKLKGALSSELQRDAEDEKRAQALVDRLTRAASN